MYQQKDGCHERGRSLDRIAESLNSVTTIWFKVDQRAFRDKIKKLLQLHVTKRNKEECFSEISPEHTELDDLLQDIYEWKKESEVTYHQQSSKMAKQINKKKEAAEDMRSKSFFFFRTQRWLPRSVAKQLDQSCKQISRYLSHHLN